MRKTRRGYKFTITLDEETAEFIIRFAQFDCRSPESAAKAFLIKEARKRTGRDKDV